VGGGAKFATTDNPGPTYLACSCTIETTEFARPRDGAATDFSGTSFTLGTGNGEGIIPNLVEAVTELP
jgi:hypothetical protein